MVHHTVHNEHVDTRIMRARLVAVEFQRWALRLEVMRYKSCGSGSLWDLFEIGSGGEDHGAQHGAVRGSAPSDPECKACGSRVLMVGPETPGPELQIVWVASPVGLGLHYWARRRRLWFTARIHHGDPHRFLSVDLQNPTV